MAWKWKGKRSSLIGTTMALAVLAGALLAAQPMLAQLSQMQFANGETLTGPTGGWVGAGNGTGPSDNNCVAASSQPGGRTGLAARARAWRDAGAGRRRAGLEAPRARDGARGPAQRRHRLVHGTPALHGIDPAVARELLLCWNRAHCRPPLSDAEVARTVESITRTHFRHHGGADADD